MLQKKAKRVYARRACRLKRKSLIKRIEDIRGQCSEPVNMADELERREAKSLSNKLIKELNLSKNGTAISAPQIGEFKRVIVVKIKKIFITMVNPTVLDDVDTEHYTDIEGCLSICGGTKFYRVIRPLSGKVRYMNLQGVERELDCAGVEYRRVLHEIDHLNGIDIQKIGKEV